MNAKTALIKALLDGKTVNIRNVHSLTSYTNASREIGRSVERAFGVRVDRTHREGKNRYKVHCIWTDYKLPQNGKNKEGIKKMKEYVKSQTA